MSPDHIKAKAARLAELFAAMAAGKTLQINYGDVWKDCLITSGPRMSSDLSRWRVKPEPRTFWHREGTEPMTTDPELAEEWRKQHWTVVETVEVIK